MTRFLWPVLIACGLLGPAPAARAADPPPLSAITDAKAHTGASIKAIRRAWAAADAGEADRAEIREMLKKAAWARSRFYEVRIAAIDELLADEANLADTRNMLRLMLPTETQWNVIDLLGRTAADRGWRDHTTALVRCWSRPVIEPTDDERPERKALERLHADRPVEEVIFAVFAGEASLSPETRGIADSREREQQDAWALLRRLDKTGARTVALLSQPGVADEDATLATLRAAARELHVIPDSPEQVAWVTRLHADAYRNLWAECSAAVAALSDEQRMGLQLRHLMGLRWAATQRSNWITSDRGQLLSLLEATLKPRKRHVRPSSATASRRAPEALRTWRDQLSWGDALLCLIAAEAAEDPALARVIFTQAEDDRADTSTEHGGVIDGVPGGFAVRLFPPRPAQRAGDRRFVAPPEMIEQGVDSIFHYHLHCTSRDNADYAGPSDDDITYARSQGRSCLVFTFVGANSINADYYQPSGATIDLGTLKRPE